MSLLNVTGSYHVFFSLFFFCTCFLFCILLFASGIHENVFDEKGSARLVPHGGALLDVSLYYNQSRDPVGISANNSIDEQFFFVSFSLMISLRRAITIKIFYFLKFHKGNEQSIFHIPILLYSPVN